MSPQVWGQLTIMAAETLMQALDVTIATSWHGMRSAGPRESQARQAIADLIAHTRVRELEARHVTMEHLRAVIRLWQGQKLAPGTIRQRLSCLHIIGVETKGSGVRVPRKLKWWLNPEDEEEVCDFLSRGSATIPAMGQMVYLIRTTARTGLRIEESLSLRWQHLRLADLEKATILVPGTKTLASQATLPLSPEAAALYAALRRTAKEARPDQRVYPELDYPYARLLWQECREHLGVTHIPTATLRSMRRSAARYLTVRGMPLPLVRDYLRHNDVKTTMGYLTLTGGGYREDEMRKWL